MIHLDIKPLSVNSIFKGRRFKSKVYSVYEKNILFMLPKYSMPSAPFYFKIEVGFSNKASDLDNICKPLIDILCKKYGFNDKDIYALDLRKMIVLKGKEYIKINIEHYEQLRADTK